MSPEPHRAATKETHSIPAQHTINADHTFPRRPLNDRNQSRSRTIPSRVGPTIHDSPSRIIASNADRGIVARIGQLSTNHLGLSTNRPGRAIACNAASRLERLSAGNADRLAAGNVGRLSAGNAGRPTAVNAARLTAVNASELNPDNTGRLTAGSTDRSIAHNAARLVTSSFDQHSAKSIDHQAMHLLGMTTLESIVAAHLMLTPKFFPIRTVITRLSAITHLGSLGPTEKRQLRHAPIISYPLTATSVFDHAKKCR